MLCVLLTVCCVAALAETGTTEYSLGEVYARVTLSDNYIVLQKNTLGQHPEFLASKDTTEEAVLADWTERGVLLQAWTSDLDACLEIRTVQDADAEAYFDINAQTDQARKSYRSNHLKGQFENQGYDMKSAEWTRNGDGVRFLRLKYKRTVNGLVTWGYMDKTIQNGWTVILDFQVYGRGLKDRDLNRLKAVFSTLIELPESMEKIGYQDANNIEQLLLVIDETITRVVAGFTRANAFALRSGAKSLPVSLSDGGRNWGQLDAMGTTWANWQLATWYLLLYGNLKAEGVVE